MHRKTLVSIAILIVGSIGVTNGQLLKKLGKKAEKAAERTVERRVQRETEKKTDQALDQVFGDGQGKNRKQDADKGERESPQRKQAEEAAGQAEASIRSFAAYTKFDFVPGDKIIAVEDFSQDEIGDFPAKWNTNAGGQLKTIDGSEDRWLVLAAKSTATPEFVTDLPENFTLEFDLAVTPTYSSYNQPLMISIANLTGASNFAAWSRFGRGKATGVVVWLHPQDVGNRPLGQSGYELWTNGKKTMDNKMGSLESFNTANRNRVKVAMWRQNQRLRVYVDEVKLWDLPRAFAEGVDYNGLVFSRHDAKDGEEFYISNIRLAVGEPDTRNKLITAGRFSTTGIYFNSGSAIIKPESYGVLNEIATVLEEHPAIRVSIIGHTDSDGSDDLNMELSAARAAAVKAMLETEFGIAGSRMETSGQGENYPVANNSTPEGKAQNRRVEFVRQ